MVADILIHVPAGGEADPGARYGLSLAKAVGAHATGVTFAIEPVIMTAYVASPASAEQIVQMRAAAEKAAEDAAAGFKKAAEAEGVSGEARIISNTVDGVIAEFAKFSRYFDLTVLTQPNPEALGPNSELFEAALFGSGRAVLVVPYVQRAPAKLDRVMIAWDGGRAASRAVSEALPLLQRAKLVEILVVETKPTEDEIPGADLARHLARHNLKVELRRILAPSRSLVDETILNEVSDSSIDLVVMGGYGHSRLREMVLGGVTREILQALTAPVLMAH